MGFDDDLTDEVTRITNCIRSLLTEIEPGLEGRAWDRRSSTQP